MRREKAGTWTAAADSPGAPGPVCSALLGVSAPACGLKCSKEAPWSLTGPLESMSVAHEISPSAEHCSLGQG